MRTTSETEQQLRCEGCDQEFSPKQVLHISVRGPHTATYACPRCQTYVTGAPPDDIDRPPAIVGWARKTDGEGLVTAQAFFEGGAVLQFRDGSDGWVYEEVFESDGELYESALVERDRTKCEAPTEYLARMRKRYPTYTTTGLRIQRPHIAAVLLHAVVDHD